jgi:hypothetical protein
MDALEAGVIYQGPDLDQPDPYCCVPTSASMACDAATGGKKRPAVEALRKATTVAHPYGISYSAIAHATAEVANVPSEARYGLSRSQVVALASSGRPFCISIDCSVTRYTARRTGTFTGGHTIYGPPMSYSNWPGGSDCGCEKDTSTRHSEFRMQDPGTYSVGFVQWSAELLFRAAEARTGGNGINVLVFPDTTDVYRAVIEAGWVRSKPTTESAKVRRVEAGDRPRHIRRFVTGEAWFRPDGGRSTAWAELWAGGYFRGDHLGAANVAAP